MIAMGGIILFEKDYSYYKQDKITDLINSQEREFLLAANPALRSVLPLVRNPQHVYINLGKLTSTAQEYAGKHIALPEWKIPVFIDTDDYEKKANFFYIGNSINFQFTGGNGTKYSTKYKDESWSGAFGMWAALKRALDENIPILDSDFLKKMSLKDAKYIFRGNHIEIPMIEERVSILNEVGQNLSKLYEGNFINLIKSSGNKLFNNGDGIVERLTRDFPSFNDSYQYNNRTVFFNKRAQLAAAMLMENEPDNPLSRIDDVNEFTVFADYTVPNALRSLGIMEYEKALQEKVDKRIPLGKGSLQELEIRASTIISCRLLRNMINQFLPRSQKINDLHIDSALWFQGRKVETPHHITKTIAY